MIDIDDVLTVIALIGFMIAFYFDLILITGGF